MKKLLVILLVFLTICLSGCVTINIYYNGAENGKENSSSAPEESLSEEESSAPAESEPGLSHSSSEEESSRQEESSAESGSGEKPYDATYRKSGTFDYEQSLNTVTIQAGDVVLKNKTILKNLYIRSGSVTLENCSIPGTLIFTGGGSLVLKNCSIASAEVKSGENAMLMLSGSKIDALRLSAGCTIQNSGGGCSVGSVTLSQKEIAVTADSLAIDTVIMDAQASFRLENSGSVDETEVYVSCTLSSDTKSGCVYKKVSVLPGRGYVKIHLRAEDAQIGELHAEESVYPELIGKAEIGAYSGNGSRYTS